MFFFFNVTATAEIYTLSLHDALPISRIPVPSPPVPTTPTTHPFIPHPRERPGVRRDPRQDRRVHRARDVDVEQL